MNQEDLCLRLNGNELAQFRALGETLDVTFFAENKRFFHGRQKFEFYVGNRLVRFDVRMRPFVAEVYNDFAPFGAREFVDVEKMRVHAEMEAAGFKDRPSGVYYLPADVLRVQNRLPEFDEVSLARDPEGSKFFVSHRWTDRSHPDPYGDHLALFKEHAREHPGAFYWIDYSCLPQPRLRSSTKLLDEALPKLTSIQSSTSTIVVMDEYYDGRLWCRAEHYFGVLFSQTNFNPGNLRTIHYLGGRSPLGRQLVDEVQFLREPEWDRLRVTNAADVPFVKANFKFLTNVVKFQLVDRFAELFNSMPGVKIYCAGSLPHPQSAFGLSYAESLTRIREIYALFEWRAAELYQRQSLNRIAALLAQSDKLEAFSLDDLRFSKHLFYSKESVAYLALLIAMIRNANDGGKKLRNLRTLCAKLVIMSMIR